MPLAEALQNANNRIAIYRGNAHSAIATRSAAHGSRFMQSILSSGGGLGAILYGTNQLSAHAEQYKYNKGYVYSAVRPICVRVATQEIRVGRMKGSPKRRRGQAGQQRLPGSNRRGAASDKGFLTDEFQIKSIMDRAPLHLKSAVAEGMQIFEDHPIVRAISDPNELMVRWHLMYATAASLQLTGKGFWWLTTDPNDPLTFDVWPLPASWVMPYADQEKRSLLTGWKLIAPGVPENLPPIPSSDMCYFYYPDPANPISGAFSPLQSQAEAVTTSDYIARSQLASYKNGPRPSLILKAGQMLDAEGRPTGQRRQLTPEQRSDLIEVIKLLYSGAEKNGEPFIVDGVIEDIEKVSNTPAEMDYLNSDQHVKNRIDQGFGVNPIVMGQTENANRASAYVADEYFCRNVVNPLLSMMSQVLTKRFAPRYSDMDDLQVWIDECEPFDADLTLAKMETGISSNVVTVNEHREYLGLKRVPGGDKVPALEPPPMPGIPTENGAGKGIPRAGQGDQQGDDQEGKSGRGKQGSDRKKPAPGKRGDRGRNSRDQKIAA